MAQVEPMKTRDHPILASIHFLTWTVLNQSSPPAFSYMSLLDTKLEINSGSDAGEPTSTRNNQQQQLTKDALEHLPNDTSRQANTSD
jgi:hypothetical protein